MLTAQTAGKQTEGGFRSRAVTGSLHVKLAFEAAKKMRKLDSSLDPIKLDVTLTWSDSQPAYG